MVNVNVLQDLQVVCERIVMSRRHRTPTCEPFSTHLLELSATAIRGNFSRKSQNFPITPVFLPPLPEERVFPWNWVLALEIKNANDGAIGPKRSLTITYTYVTDNGQTDEQMDTG